MTNKRTLAEIRQAAWNAVHKDYKDDPECCFALGFDAGYDAVAQKVEPPVSESGEGFESLPASPVAWGVDEGEGRCISLHDLYFVQSDAQHMAELKGPHAKAIPLYTSPPQREWVGLTDEEARELCVANVPYVVDMVRALEAKLKEKNA